MFQNSKIMQLLPKLVAPKWMVLAMVLSLLISFNMLIMLHRTSFSTAAVFRELRQHRQFEGQEGWNHWARWLGTFGCPICSEDGSRDSGHRTKCRQEGFRIPTWSHGFFGVWEQRRDGGSRSKLRFYHLLHFWRRIGCSSLHQPAGALWYLALCRYSRQAFDAGLDVNDVHTQIYFGITRRFNSTMQGHACLCCEEWSETHHRALPTLQGGGSFGKGQKWKDPLPGGLGKWSSLVGETVGFQHMIRVIQGLVPGARKCHKPHYHLWLSKNGSPSPKSSSWPSGYIRIIMFQTIQINFKSILIIHNYPNSNWGPGQYFGQTHLNIAIAVVTP